MDDTENHIESILFLKGEPMTIKQLSKLLKKTESEIKSALSSLQEKLSERGIRLLKKEDSFMLATAPESSKFTKELIKEEFDSELSKAALETLAIVVYRGPITRAEIDHIRGVNSTFTARNLLIKGLIEREINPKDSRSYLYKSSFQLLQYLGIQSIKDIPEYEDFNKKTEEFIENVQREQKINNITDNT